MVKQHGAGGSSSFQLKSKLQRFGLAALVAAAFGLMLLGKADILLVEKGRILFNDIAAPVLMVLSKPAEMTLRVMQNLHELVSIRRQNAVLRAENEKLNLIKLDTEQLRRENEELRNLMKYIPLPEASSVSAKVIADTGNSFVQSLLAYTGYHHTVKKGNVVLTGEGVLGRISSVGVNVARILLITDINSRIPVKVEPMNAQAILSGDNTEYPQLISLPNNVKISVGDRVITSGAAGVYPAGLPIGTIVSVADGIIKVRPFVNRNHLEIVRIVDYGLSGLLADPICEVSR